ncbi:hypothetical protein E0H51_05820 [Rhizobium leguminosarum bv. viciae]|nr:hypothetical protein E0H51_05820 [Rhizobium leguminosarum bv. viciae]
MPVAALAECLSPRGRMAVAARPAGHVALRIQGVHDGGDSYPTMRDGRCVFFSFAMANPSATSTNRLTANSAITTCR